MKLPVSPEKFQKAFAEDFPKLVGKDNKPLIPTTDAAQEMSAHLSEQLANRQELLR